MDYFKSLHTLDALNLFQILLALLLDMKIIIISKDKGNLAVIFEILISLIHPFQTSSILIPCVNKDTIEFIDAPVPYIIGMG